MRLDDHVIVGGYQDGDRVICVDCGITRRRPLRDAFPLVVLEGRYPGGLECPECFEVIVVDLGAE